MVTSSMIKNPKLIFGFCLGYRVFFSSSKYLGFYRDEQNLANSLMLVATIKMILVAYEVFDYRDRDEKNNQPKSYTFGVLQLEKEPTQLDIFCYMTCFVGLFTGPIYKYRTFYDMIMSPYRPISQTLWKHIRSILGATVVFLIGLFLFDMKYFTSENLLTDTLVARLLHVYPVGFIYQMRYIVAWLLGEGICILVGLGMYPNTTNPQPGKGPTQHPQNLKFGENQEKLTFEHNFKTVENIQPLTGIVEISFWKTLHHWNCCVQWWLSQFIYRSNVLPKSMRGARVFLTLCFSALWHGIKPGYFMCLLPLPFFAALEESCFYLQRKYIRHEKTRSVLCG
uniref:Leukocyte receptor cluster member 4 n=1 Tax=Phallusia mammillata TaxID=59560 RepID=A0A6F9DJR5_9ASCI|nr:lysophospholipid acyltransferase 7-like [Phallusia mammillata]